MDSKFFPSRGLFFSACLLSVVFASAAFAQKAAFVPNELLVKFTGGASSKLAGEANRLVGAAAIETLGDSNWQRVQIPAGLALSDAMESYKHLDGVEYVQPNYYYHLLATPNDPQFTNTGMYGLTKIGAPLAWDLSTGSSGVVVADIDTGMRYTHQDLAPNAWINTGEIPANGIDDDGNGFIDDIHGWDFFYNDNDPIDDAGGHGTHTAGTIGAAGNNSLNVTGVNWSVKIMNLKIYSPNGTDSTSAMLVNSYAYIRMMKLRGVNIRATNNSYGNCGEACGYDQATKDGIDAMGNAGIVSAFAAGNDNNNNDTNPGISYPSVYTSPSIISVASSTSTDAKSSFSSFGLVSVDLAAPGSSVLSTWNTSDTATNTISGTSMATPHVAGAIALLSAYRPDLSVASIKASLLNNVDVIAAWSGLVRTGGRLNVFKAMQSPTVCTFPTAMSVPTKGGIFSVNIVPGVPNCDYFVKSQTNWIKVTSADTQTGNSTLTFRVPKSPTLTRTGTIVIGGQVFTITQQRN